ncbi:MAG: hypothetical protein GHCLOJNM_03765 [bacterium]|nr:hypothetical protein [bacterium]
MGTHVKLLGVLFLAYGLYKGFFALLFLLALAGVGFIPGFLVAGPLGGIGAGTVLSVIGFFLVLYSALLALFLAVAGYGLLQRKRWARVLGIVAGALSLIHFPLGTLLGIYTLWALLKEETARLFERPWDRWDPDDLSDIEGPSRDYRSSSL